MRAVHDMRALPRRFACHPLWVRVMRDLRASRFDSTLTVLCATCVQCHTIAAWPACIACNACKCVTCVHCVQHVVCVTCKQYVQCVPTCGCWVQRVQCVSCVHCVQCVTCVQRVTCVRSARTYACYHKASLQRVNDIKWQWVAGGVHRVNSCSVWAACIACNACSVWPACSAWHASGGTHICLLPQSFSPMGQWH